MTSRGWLAATLAGFMAGLAGGLFGVGGGIILVPMLTAFFALSQHQAHGTSLAAIGATAIAGVIVYGLAGHVAWLPAALMSLASVFTARLGARLAARTSRERLTLFFAVFLLLVAARLLTRSATTAPEHVIAGPLELAAALGVGALVGLLAGFMGVGGGLIAVPALTLLFGMSQQTAQGTQPGHHPRHRADRGARAQPARKRRTAAPAGAGAGRAVRGPARLDRGPAPAAGRPGAGIRGVPDRERGPDAVGGAAPEAGLEHLRDGRSASRLWITQSPPSGPAVSHPTRTGCPGNATDRQRQPTLFVAYVFRR